jgi:spermidine/putrescine transport system substrate-binding protein
MSERITRKQLLGRAATGGAGLSLAAFLAACGGGGIGGGGATETAPGPATQPQGTTTTAKPELHDIVWSNWPLYIDVDEKTKSHPTLDAFEKKYGISVKYIEDINANEEFFGKIQGPLSRGESIGRDLIVLTDASGLPSRMIELGWLEKLDKDAMPNAANLIEAQQHPSFDPNRDYTMPWQSGMTGIGFDPKRTGGDITSIEQLLTDPKLKGKVWMLTEMGDTIGLVMLANGDDPTNVTDETFDRAVKTVQDALDSGQVRQFTGNDYAPLLAKGDLWAGFAWSGDLVQLQLDHPGLKWVQPDTGSMIWTDNLMIPKGGDAYTASTLINYYYDPAVAAQVEDYVNYICPVNGAKEALLKQDPDVAKNVLIFPTDQMLANAHLFDSKAALNQAYREKFQALIGA